MKMLADNGIVPMLNAAHQWTISPNSVRNQLRACKTCRCCGPVAQLLSAAVVVEDVSLQGVADGGKLLATLTPASGTLRVLDVTDVGNIGTGNDVRTAQFYPPPFIPQLFNITPLSDTFTAGRQPAPQAVPAGGQCAVG